MFKQPQKTAPAQLNRVLSLLWIIATTSLIVPACIRENPIPIQSNCTIKNLIEVTDLSSKSEIFGSANPVLICFYADWCTPSKIIKPRWEALAEEFDGKVKFVKVNVENSDKMVEGFSIDSIPRMHIYIPNCHVSKYLDGVKTKKQIKFYIKESLQNCK